MGPGQRDGRPRELHRQDWNRRLFLRSALTLATGYPREHQRLLRQYFPKGTDLSGYAQAELDAVADELNNRPRQTLNWKKPTEVFNQFLVEAG